MMRSLARRLDAEALVASAGFRGLSTEILAAVGPRVGAGRALPMAVGVVLAKDFLLVLTAHAGVLACAVARRSRVSSPSSCRLPVLRLCYRRSVSKATT